MPPPLPPELLESVLTHLTSSPPALRACALTSTTLHALARPLLFHTLRTDGRPCAALTQLLDARAGLGACVRVLHLGPGSGAGAGSGSGGGEGEAGAEVLTAATLSQLLVRLPRLRVLTLAGVALVHDAPPTASLGAHVLSALTLAACSGAGALGVLTLFRHVDTLVVRDSASSTSSPPPPLLALPLTPAPPTHLTLHTPRPATLLTALTAAAEQSNDEPERASPEGSVDILCSVPKDVDALHALLRLRGAHVRALTLDLGELAPHLHHSLLPCVLACPQLATLATLAVHVGTHTMHANKRIASALMAAGSFAARAPPSLRVVFFCIRVGGVDSRAALALLRFAFLAAAGAAPLKAAVRSRSMELVVEMDLALKDEGSADELLGEFMRERFKELHDEGKLKVVNIRHQKSQTPDVIHL